MIAINNIALFGTDEQIEAAKSIADFLAATKGHGTVGIGDLIDNLRKDLRQELLLPPNDWAGMTIKYTPPTEEE
jgi:hypothetical protein